MKPSESDALSQSRPWLRVGTDASLGAPGKGSGVGYIADTGEHGSKFCRHVNDTTTAELLAVRMAVQELLQAGTGPARNLHVLTDSRAVIRLLDNPRRAAPTLQRHVQELVDLRAAGRLEITWVRGHSGHPLNEGADRLSRDVRRAKQWGSGSRLRVQENIVAETLAALNTNQSA
ncbi:ribonuclease H (plasmid) [Tsukamurella tyrosinosolvens]|uniref:Ribonuclease HI n=1 Tax=Tsukamurella tyrosinosolvens TaxID=57704 RepID=A0A1H4VBH4_TSUTY|nr:ribonuclease H family protein [Tsukamurella tyrosinosolvens]KXO91013.1 hypothetical protein AXK58_21525 [Tsukamurella tyrosinosolvens]SEC78230.1 Ribonuclease HI [Tsukamurella tyrosinosolvens]VEH90600.1 ribonuclease H [Tsukamurella tyrosinosolvens]